MIESYAQYALALNVIKQNKEYEKTLFDYLVSQNFSKEEIDRGMAPTLSFHAGLTEEVEYFEQQELLAAKEIHDRRIQ